MGIKIFIRKIFHILTFLLIGIILILFGIPKDDNAYLCEYNNKVDIIVNTQSPRLILIGSSCIAFNIDSKQISERLGVRVINLGLMGGIGARFYLDDFLQFIKKGDLVVISPSYMSDFIEGGHGTQQSLASLMMSTNWRNFSKLDMSQMCNIFKGVPYVCYMNIVRLIRLPFNKFSFNSSKENDEFRFVASGFNQYGDESSHWVLPFRKGHKTKMVPANMSYDIVNFQVDKGFCLYLKTIIGKYEEKGADVLLMPEISSETTYHKINPNKIESDIKQYGLTFFTNPKYLQFSDSLGYDVSGGAHFCRQGVTIVSDRVSNLLRENTIARMWTLLKRNKK